MRTVHKFVLVLPFGQGQKIRMPARARIVHVAMQGGHLCLWAVVRTDNVDVDTRTFYVTGTGTEVEPWWLTHVGTVLAGDDGRVVLHVWEDPL